jgi:hypothetical protein
MALGISSPIMIAGVLGFVDGGILFIWWLMTSTMRLEDAGFPLLHHRLWAIFGWFTPIWLFFRPYQMVSQLYVGSLPSFSPASKIDWERQPDDVVGIWWGCFIAMTISLKVSDRPGMALFFGTAFALGAAYCITRVMLRVEWRLGERACKTRPIRWPGKVLLFLLIALNLGIVGQHGFEPAGHKLRMAAKETDLKAVQDILDDCFRQRPRGGCRTAYPKRGCCEFV